MLSNVLSIAFTLDREVVSLNVKRMTILMSLYIVRTFDFGWPNRSPVFGIQSFSGFQMSTNFEL